MIAALIRAAIAHRLFVLLAALTLAMVGVYSVMHTPVDALPDLSDTCSSCSSSSIKVSTEMKAARQSSPCCTLLTNHWCKALNLRQ